jgi:regulator of protease activity HflC (stomatin/prohibitin superfamily)
VASGGNFREAAAGVVQQAAGDGSSDSDAAGMSSGGDAGDRTSGGGAADSASGSGADGSAALDPADFVAARDQSAATGTRLTQESSSLDNAGDLLNHSSYENGPEGPIHVITPMVMPKGRSVLSIWPVFLLIIIGGLGALATTPFGGLRFALFGPHYWVIVVALAVFLWWRKGMVMVPDGCQAMVTRFGKVEAEVGPGLVTLFSPWKRVSYIVNTTREYPFNAPVREAPTRGGVKASVNLFLQFRINDPREFIFVLGAVRGFEDKLNNAISETTRSLIYAQEAADIYDLVGGSTTKLLSQLNEQFQPAVELTHANITHAEPSSQDYRMDLASPEMVRVAKEAYTYQYELQLKKEQNEGDLNKDLASLNETSSSIGAEIAKYQAQMDTALERETNRADAVARQRFVEAESDANANAALLEAQALDIRALSAAKAPEILDYRYQQHLLDKLEGVAESLPQVVRVGGEEAGAVNFLAAAQELVGGPDTQLFTSDDMEAIRSHRDDIAARVEDRKDDIADLLKPPEAETVETTEAPPTDEDLPGADRLEEIRASVTGQTAEAGSTSTQSTAEPSPPGTQPADGSSAPATQPAAESSQPETQPPSQPANGTDSAPSGTVTTTDEEA